MEEEKQEIVDSSNKLQLYLPTRVTKPENWQFIKLVAPSSSRSHQVFIVLSSYPSLRGLVILLVQWSGILR